MLLLLDNYDSFTFNLYDYLIQCGTSVEVVRNDQIDVDTIGERYSGIVLSPGPGVPKNAGRMMEVIERYHTKLPMYGVCLGMQALAQFFGAHVIKANYPMHGKVSTLESIPHAMFNDIEPPFEVCRYHSLVVEDLPNELQALAFTPEQEIMAIAHRKLPLWGVQFHPEAILTTQGLKLIRNWLTCFTLQE